jgi:peroxiredoxin
MKSNSWQALWAICGLVLAIVEFPNVAWSEDPPAAPMPAERKAGHSSHGEVFDEGPRQKAYLIPGMPPLEFPITTKVPEAQAYFLQGLGQLHGFWYFEAERSFRQAAQLDPDCAMAYWGMAWANENNEKRLKGFAAEADKRKGSVSPREKMYIEALDRYAKSPDDKKKERDSTYMHDLEKILYEFPDDIEAKAMLVGQIWKDRYEGNPINSFLAVDALLDQVFAKNPMHPAHHYRVHLWDDERPKRALESAARCGQSSPGIAHMWHMPGHTYSKVQRYHDAAWQQEAGSRVDHAYMIRDRVLPDQIHNYAHNEEWLVTDLIYIGRVGDALELSKNLIAHPRHPKYNGMKSERASNWNGRRRLMDVLHEYELWDDAIALCDSPYLEPTDDPEEQIRRLRLLGRAHYAKGQWIKANAIWADLGWQVRDKKKEQDRLGAEAEAKAKMENKPQPEIDKARNDARSREQGDIDRLQRAVDFLTGWQAVAAGDSKAAVEYLKKGEADNGVIAAYQIASGDVEGGLKASQEAVDGGKQRVLPLCRQVENLFKAGKRDEAKAAMEKLRELSYAVDNKAPIFDRMSATAKELGYEGDWRIQPPALTDVGDRPALDTLGPFAWSPPPAPSFNLKDAAGGDRTLGGYQGKPVVVIFFLGHGCLHCAEQLHAFAPRLADFQAAGIEVLAISSDNEEGLQKSIAAYKGGPLPIPLAADPNLETFKTYRCFDDFENTSLHGTYFIDGKGRLRWWDIGADPFMDVQFVLDEAKRQMALSN